MPAFALFIKERTRDAAELATYAGLAGPSLQGHPARVHAAYGPLETLEGAGCEGVVLIEFPDMAAAKAWYESPAYTAARRHRLLGADYRVVFFEGL